MDIIIKLLLLIVLLIGVVLSAVTLLKRNKSSKKQTNKNADTNKHRDLFEGKVNNSQTSKVNKLKKSGMSANIKTDITEPLDEENDFIEEDVIIDSNFEIEREEMVVHSKEII